MDIEELKQQARTLEEQGDAAGALAIYRKIFDEIEGTRAILGELPLYVKAGDLLLKQHHAKDAVAMYDRAARLYAQHGSAKSVLALCGRILTISPRATSVYPRYAGLMVRTGHVPDACAVLKQYAEAEDLPAVVEALEPFADRTDEDATRAIQMLIEVVGRNEDLKRELAAQAERPQGSEEARAATPEPTEPQPTPEPGGDAAAAPPPEPSSGPAAGDATERAGPEPAAPGAEAESEDLSFLRADLQVEPKEEDGAGSEAGPLDADPLLVEKAGYAVVHGFEPVPPDELGPEAPGEPERGAAGAGGPAAGAPARAGDQIYKEYARDSRRPSRERRPATDARSGSRLSWLVLLVVVVGGGAGLYYFDMLPQGVMDLLGGSTPAVAVGGLPIVSVDPYPSGEVTGSRVVQRLVTGELLTLTVLPAADGSVVAGVSDVRVRRVLPDSSTGTARVGRFEVTAGGRLSAGVLDGLLRRLVEQE